MIAYPLAAKFFEGFSILRWNDRLRPTEFIEIDHHAMKSMITFFLGKSVEDEVTTVDWIKIVDGNVFDLMRKISTSDIHAKIRTKLNNDDAVREAINKKILDDWSNPQYALEKLDDTLIGRFSSYINCQDKSSVESGILTFSHKFTTLNEFEIVKSFNGKDADLDAIETEINVDIDNAVACFNEKRLFIDLVLKIRRHDKGEKLVSLIHFMQRLRYQIRWSQTPRIPSTNVLGHSMLVAVMVYFISLEAGLSKDRIINNFYAALFHDLPEAWTRDIISPIKNADDSISEKVSIIELEIVENEILACIPESWRSHMQFILGHFYEKNGEGIIQPMVSNECGLQEYKIHGEFSNRKSLDPHYKAVRIVPWGKEGKKPEEYLEEMDPMCPGVDGKIIKVCDGLAAYLEASMSVKYGLRSPHLDDGMYNTKTSIIGKQIYGLEIKDFFKSIVF